MGPDGRILIPVELRRELGFEAGMRLVARIEGRQLVLASQEAALRRLQERFASVPEEVSLVDELLADRRRDAARDRGG